MFSQANNNAKGVIHGYGRVTILLDQNMACSSHYIPGPCFIYTQSAVRGPQFAVRSPSSKTLYPTWRKAARLQQKRTSREKTFSSFL